MISSGDFSGQQPGHRLRRRDLLLDRIAVEQVQGLRQGGLGADIAGADRFARRSAEGGEEVIGGGAVGDCTARRPAAGRGICRWFRSPG